MKLLWDLYLTWFKMGLFTFGGGYAMLPMIQKEVIDKHHWATEEEIMNYYAIGQCLPGVIMVNTLIFIGQKRKGTIGGIVAALGTVCPALIIIGAIAALLTNFAEVEAVKKAFAGIRVCVCVLILNAVIKLWKSSVCDWKCFLIFALVAGLSLFTDVTPVLFVVAAALAGILIKCMGSKK